MSPRSDPGCATGDRRQLFYLILSHICEPLAKCIGVKSVRKTSRSEPDGASAVSEHADANENRLRCTCVGHTEAVQREFFV